MQILDFNQETTRTVIEWVGASVVAVSSAAWAVFKFFYPKKEKKTETSVSASHGGVAAGRDIRNSRIEISHDARPE